MKNCKNRKVPEECAKYSKKNQKSLFINLSLLRLNYILFGIGLFCTCFIHAQEYKTSIKVIARPLPDSILLRWAPTNFEGWDAGNRFGYKIIRFTIIKNGEVVPNPQTKILTSQPIKPWPGDKWEKIIATDDYAAVAAQAIFGETFELTTGKSTNAFDVVNKVKEQDSRFSFALFAADMSPLAARASGLFYSDKNVKKGEKYLYRIILQAPNNEITSDTGFVYTGVDESLPLPKPFAVKAEFGDKGVIIHWERKTFDYLYNSYSVERSEDGKHFEKINKQPIVYTASSDFNETSELLYIDSLAVNDKIYYYQVSGNTAFGETSPPSEVVSGMGVVDIKTVLEIKEDFEQNGRVFLKWDYPSFEEKNIKGFKILRAFEFKTAYDTVSGLLSPTTREFTDFQPMSVNYYKIEAIAINGKGKSSVPSMVQMVDSIPPLPPIDLKAVADTSGKLILNWKANTEKDIFGYRVFRANEPNDEYSQITIAPVEDTIFVDSINVQTLTPNVYYKLMAIDKRQNHSDFSEPLEVKKPDIIPPAAPVIVSIKSGTAGIFLHWIASNSRDVAKYQFLRKEKETKMFSIIKDIPVADTSRFFTDTSAVTGKVYYYSIIAIDETGNRSDPSVELAGQKMPLVSRNNLGEIKCRADRKDFLIEISWNSPVEKVNRYIIYRKTGSEGRYAILTTITGEIPKFRDKKVKADTRYYYMIKAAMENGNTMMSSETDINF